MGRYSVAIVNYGKNPHSACFEDFARAMKDALVILGHEVVPHSDAKPGRLIIFGGNNVTDPNNNMPADAIIYNSEQVSAKQQWNLMENLPKYRKRVVWDYAQTNVTWLRSNGVDRAVLCPVGYVSSMTKIAPSDKQDVDVLFYGSVNGPRREILEKLMAAKLKVKHLFGIYGEERDQWIAHSKVVLNLHFYENPIFEIFRCSHLFANKKAVVTEDGGIDVTLESFAKDACIYATRDKIVEECLALCDDAQHRREVEENGFQKFVKVNLLDSVHKALAASEL